ncbi:MAG TPA: sulfatase-like hydrolase/transferase, partial [Pirellulales bacterium]
MPQDLGSRLAADVRSYRRARGSFAMGVVFAIAGLMVLSPTAETQAAERAKQPNIVFIMADDLGYGDLGCYGQKQIKTPRIDALAADGLRFTQFYAGSTVCAPSRCCLMTGVHTGHAFIRGNAKANLRPEDPTVAETLHAAGYETALIGKWGLGHEGSTGTPNKQGFDYFFGYLDQTHAHNFYPEYLIKNESRFPLKNVVPKNKAWKDGQGVASEKVEYSHDLFAADALRFLEQKRSQPFFLYLALTLPHANNEAGKEGMEVPDLGAYAKTDWPAPERGHAAMISRMDADVGRVIDKLKELGLADDTIVIFTSDNG